MSRCPWLRTLVLAVLLSLPLRSGLALADPHPPVAMSAGELREALRRLQVTASVLYVGAHPDDDNTSLLAWLARGRLVRTGYLSLTRGDGGQNILGDEKGDALGVLRTQELLASRRVDGAQQLFTRALDYGFSKSPDEALSFWGHDRALADVVWVIRRFQPDVIVTRFGTDGSGGHGHHTASAILAGEAFRAAADSTRFPEQLRGVRPWQAKRLLWNSFFLSPEDRRARGDSILTVDDGAYDPELGLSYPEIGGRARSLNRSQGAGTRERRGSVIESFLPVDGERAQKDLFDGVVMDWTRVPGAAPLASLLAEAERSFDPGRPWAILPTLARAHAALAALPASPLTLAKQRELEEVMRSCAGLWLEGIADTPTACPGDTIHVTFLALNRSPAPLTLAGLSLPLGARAFYAAASASPAPGATPKVDPSAPADAGSRPLASNQPVLAVAVVVLPADAPFTQPYWLVRRPSAGSFELDDPTLVGSPENAPALGATARVEIAGETIAFEVPVVYRWTDRVLGDRYRALEVLPPVTCRFEDGVVLFNDARPRELRLEVNSVRGPVKGSARLRLPEGWRAEPESVPVQLAAGAQQRVHFRVTPGAGAVSAALGAEVEVAGRRYDSSLARIDYPHVPIQTLLSPCEARLVRTDLAVRGQQVAYLMGTGDEVPDALRQMGLHVTLLRDDEVESAELSRYDCIVTGVRAFNTRPRLRVLEPRLLDYVQAGGRLVVQYCTDEDALKDRLGPWPLTISRDRVAVEEAEVRFPRADHPLLRAPNAITARDFEGWVQERGLNFANPFDPRYDAVLASHDPGEPDRLGGLLYTRYGKGAFIYTGLSFFRQLPAGVPGAWRLFANLVSPER